MLKETAVELSPNKHHGTKVQCSGSTCGRRRESIAPHMGVDTTTQYSPVLVTEIMGVLLERGRQVCKACRQEPRGEMGCAR